MREDYTTTRFQAKADWCTFKDRLSVHAGGSLPYNIKLLEAAAVVLWCYITCASFPSLWFQLTMELVLY